MKLKRIICLLCVMALCAAVCGCGTDAPIEDPTTTATTTTANGVADNEIELSTTATTTTAQQGNSTTKTRNGLVTDSASSNKATTTSGATTGTSAVDKPHSTSGSTGTTTGKVTIHKLTPLDESAYYGLSELKKMKNSAALVAAYQKIVSAAEAGTKDVPMDGSLTADEIVTVFFYYREDYPQHFWVDGTVSHRTQNGAVVQVTLSYNMTGDMLSQAKQKFSQEVQSLMSIAATGANDYERELLLHDALAKRVVYRDGKHAHDAYGAIVEKQAVCEGYARAFQYVLYQAGIQCLIAEGSGISPSTGKAEPHAWNVARIDGQYYHVDLTWDDANHDQVPVMYAYFNMTTAQIQNDGHVIRKENGYDLPNCTATAANYHVKNGTRLTTYTVDAVANLVKAHPQGAHMLIVGDQAAFRTWLGNNIREIAKKAGITTGFSYNTVNIGSEYVLRITAK